MKIQHPPGPQDEALGPILDAASAVFAEAGYGGARVDEIAKRAGVNKAMLYYYVGGKDALYEAVLSRNFQRLSEAMDGALEAGGDAEARLRRIIASVVKALAEIPDHPRLMLHEVAGAGQSLPKRVLEQMAGIFERVRLVLEQGQKEGSFRAVDPLLTHVTIVGGIVFLLASRPLAEHLREILKDRVPARAMKEDLADSMTQLVMQGIMTPGAAPRRSAAGGRATKSPGTMRGSKRSKEVNP
jgi:TetR/AcrR family transcriptional regulator